MDSADASPESQGSSVTVVLLGFTASLSAFPAIVTEMAPSWESVTQAPELASARKMWKAENAVCVDQDHSIWTEQTPRAVPAAFVLE